MFELNYNGFIINQQTDGYVNATEMCTANNKRLHDWNRLKSTGEYIEQLISVTGIPATVLVKGFSDSFGNQQTWVHPLLAIQLGRWISPAFAIWCDMHIKTKIEEQQPQPRKLSHGEQSVKLANEIRHITDTLDDNPRLAQVLIDNSLQDIGIHKQLPGAKQLVGVVEVALELGYKVDHSSRVRLGQFVARQGFTPVKEKRLCNGAMREINCYEDSEELRKAVDLFFTR